MVPNHLWNEIIGDSGIGLNDRIIGRLLMNGRGVSGRDYRYSAIRLKVDGLGSCARSEGESVRFRPGVKMEGIDNVAVRIDPDPAQSA